MMEFLNEILFESIVADAIFSTDLANNWIKYDFDDFKKRSQSSTTFEGWTWLLNFLRVIFFITGAFIILIATCALCGFACMLSSALRNDYRHQRQIREREEELQVLEERLRDIGINIHFDAFEDQRELERESNNEINTAIEELSTISEVDLTQQNTTASDDTINSCSTSSFSLSSGQTAFQNDNEYNYRDRSGTETEQKRRLAWKWNGNKKKNIKLKKISIK